ncbi:MAG: UDP-N-acetylmuramoyl-tripeptide--D-alanyl-D-alanine ligase [Mailhella sp.]|nr:UDP-N-acetylmuramoyl-tripeptide--D-alanyl-D-alanine ligase [Mailhella sp.]
MKITLKEASSYSHAQLLHAPLTDATFNGAAYDSRAVRPGQLFVAIRGERADGHDFADTAVHSGAAAILAERDIYEGSQKPAAPLLLVPNAVKGIGDIASACRRAFCGKVIGLTGTAGKTTTKELLSHILSMSGKTARTPMNLNTQVGLPVSILAADGDEDFWVLEAGISHPDDMDELGAIMEPDLAIILNVGAGHSLGLGGKGTAFYKSRLLRHKRPGLPALVSADYESLVSEASQFDGIAYFSVRRDDVAYHAAYLGTNSHGRGMYDIHLPGATFTADAQLTGEYAAENIIAAAAAAHLLGISASDIVRGIQTAEFPAQRFSRHELPHWTVIDDSYNANPLSASRMIAAARELAGSGDLVCVMGEMGELGSVAPEEHVRLGRNLAASGCSAVFWHGNYAEQVRQGLEESGFSGYFLPGCNALNFLEQFSKWQATAHNPDQKGVVLFKGSRLNHLENMVKLFMDKESHAL